MEKRATILAVDDTEINLDVLVGILKKYDVIPVSNAKDVFEIVQNEEIDLVLLDVIMPQIDGYEVCEALKKNEKTKDIPIIFITVKTSEEDIKKGFLCGAVDYVTKPFNPTELLSRVKTHLELEGYRKSLECKVKEEAAKNALQNEMLHRQSKQAAIGEMIMHIAHQWKQPLSELGSINLGILGKLNFNENIDKQYLETNCKQMEQIINFMSQTVQTFQDFYKPNFSNSFFSIDEVVRQACNIVSATLSYHKISLQIQTDSSAKTYGNSNEYAQVVLNLLGNAKNVLVERKIQNPTIKIEIYTENDKSVLKISDNGGGFLEQARQKIFKPFCEESGGWGIGLYMAKSIMDKNGGKIILNENNINGAEFLVIQ